jgi:hypothetical protein
MRLTLLLSMAVWVVFFVAAFQQRLRLEWLREAADRLDAARAAEPEPRPVPRPRAGEAS